MSHKIQEIDNKSTPSNLSSVKDTFDWESEDLSMELISQENNRASKKFKGLESLKLDLRKAKSKIQLNENIKINSTVPKEGSNYVIYTDPSSKYMINNVTILEPNLI
jgi:hypothetical protein